MKTGIARRRGIHAGARRGPRPIVFAIVTVSDTRRGSADRSGNAIASLLERNGHTVGSRAWVSDDPRAIRRVARAALARDDVDVAILTGGTGLAPRDRTPEALAPLAERVLPGFGEAFRVLSTRQVGTAAWLSRAGAVVVRGRLVFMLPGSTRAVTLAVRRLIIPEIVHALRTMGRFQEQE